MRLQEIHFRLIMLAVLLAVFSISATFRRRARQSGEIIQRRQEGGLVLFLRMGLALPLFLSLLLSVFYPAALQWSRFSLPHGLRVVAAVVAVLCIPLIWGVFRSIGENISETVLTKQTHQLVTWGPYRWVRHPLYAISLLMLLSFSMLASNWFLAIYWLLTLVAFGAFVIPREEQNLMAHFGEAYQAYRERTGALLPRFPR